MLQPCCQPYDPKRLKKPPKRVGEREIDISRIKGAGTTRDGSVYRDRSNQHPDFRDAIETVEQGGAVHEKRPCGGCGGTRARQVGSQGLDHVGGMLLVIGCQQVQGDVPATMLVMAQPDDVSEYCEKLIKMGMNGGFILGSGCEVPMNAKPENVAAMIASVR